MGKREEIELTNELTFFKKIFKGSNTPGDGVKEQTDKVQGDGLFLKYQQKWNRGNEDEGLHYIQNERAQKTKRRPRQKHSQWELATCPKH